MEAFPTPPPYQRPVVEAFAVAVVAASFVASSVSVLVFAVLVVAAFVAAVTSFIVDVVVAFVVTVAAVFVLVAAVVPVDAALLLLLLSMLFFLLLVAVLGNPAGGRGLAFFRPLIFTSFQTPRCRGPHYSNSSPVAVVGQGCSVTFLTGHAFNICPEASHDQRPFTTISMLFSRHIRILESRKSLCVSLLPGEQSFQ